MSNTERISHLLGKAFSDANLSLPDRRIGKVRESYALPEAKRLIITTDRLSAFDRVLYSVPWKGQVLNELSAWWFEHTGDIIANHLIAVPDPNAAIVHHADPLPIEVIVRGFISGETSTALWYRYSLGERTIYGYKFPNGLRKNDPLPTPIITPTTKGAITGHDERLTLSEVVDRGFVDAHTWERVQEISIKLFKRGQQMARRAGLMLVDTKYEFGRNSSGELMLIDEVHTPDSSRFWKAETYGERCIHGEEPENFDKEFIRLAYIDAGFRGEGTPPDLPTSVWCAASERYTRLYEMLTGQTFLHGEYPISPRLERNLAQKGWLQ